MGAIPSLIGLLDEDEAATQRLAASALCNLLANHAENTRLVWDPGFGACLRATSWQILAMIVQSVDSLNQFKLKTLNPKP